MRKSLKDAELASLGLDFFLRNTSEQGSKKQTANRQTKQPTDRPSGMDIGMDIS